MLGFGSGVAFCVAVSRRNSAVDMAHHVERDVRESGNAARRQRERRPRAFHRYEQMATMMALAAAFHHWFKQGAMGGYVWSVQTAVVSEHLVSHTSLCPNA